MAKNRTPSAADLVSEQLYGRARMVGPFPDNCPPLRRSLEKLPVSDRLIM